MLNNLGPGVGRDKPFGKTCQTVFFVQRKEQKDCLLRIGEKSVSDYEQNQTPGQPREPAFNVPAVILALIGGFALIHYYRTSLIGHDALEFLFTYAFVPGRYDTELLLRRGFTLPGGAATDIFTFVSYSFLHGNWTHLIVNALWLLIFGSALARRFGAYKFLLLSLLGSIGGALLHLWSNWGELVPMVGASAMVAAHMGATVRFAFVPFGPLGRPRSTHPGAYFLPGLSVREVFQNGQALAFTSVWLAINVLTGLGGTAFLGDNSADIAWQAHIGGFALGFLSFPLLDPARRLHETR